MISLRVLDMSCEHCVSVITRTLQMQDPAAKIQINLAQHQVDITSSKLETSQILRWVQEAGYTPNII
ncbi:MAG: heavy-metal-associated domain-containing protein [Burkholderiales bacterium]|jgi:copper chaperone